MGLGWGSLQQGCQAVGMGHHVVCEFPHTPTRSRKLRPSVYTIAMTYHRFLSSRGIGLGPEMPWKSPDQRNKMARMGPKFPAVSQGQRAGYPLVEECTPGILEGFDYESPQNYNQTRRQTHQYKRGPFISPNPCLTLNPKPLNPKP